MKETEQTIASFKENRRRAGRRLYEELTGEGAETLGDVLNKLELRTYELGSILTDPQNNASAVKIASARLNETQFFWEGLIAGAEETGDDAVAEKMLDIFYEIFVSKEDWE